MNWRRLVGYKAAEARSSTGLGPDYPTSAGDREKGKFRESAYPRLTQVAVSGDDGEAITVGTNDLLLELINEVKLLRHALVMEGLAADIDEPFN